MKRAAPRLESKISRAIQEAPAETEEVDPWLLEEIPDSACPFCHYGPLTRFEQMNGRCERCRERYIEAAGATP